MKLPPARDTRPHHHHHHHHHHLAPSPSSFTPSHIPRPKFCSFAARATHVARDRAFSHKSDTASNRHLVRKQPTRKRRNETRAKRHDIHRHKPPPPPLPHPTTSSSSSSSFFPSPPKPNTSQNHRGVPDHLRFFFFYIFWRDPGLRGLPKYVVNDGGSTRVDHENEGEAEEEEEEEGRRSVEDPGGIVQLLRFLLSFHAA